MHLRLHIKAACNPAVVSASARSSLQLYSSPLLRGETTMPRPLCYGVALPVLVRSTLAVPRASPRVSVPLSCAPSRYVRSGALRATTFLSHRAGHSMSTEPSAARLRSPPHVATASAAPASGAAVTPTLAAVERSPGVTRVRFAPSPTGTLHVGGARTALYNWLLAQKKARTEGEDGVFVVRVEDTDTARSTRASEDMVLADLEWLGLVPDEGPRAGGPAAPYRQSERLELYVALAQRLLEEGAAYPCFCSEEELQRRREEQEAAGRPPQYDGTWRDADPEVVRKKMEDGEEYTVRFRVPEGERVVIDDAVRGKVAWDANATVGDFILMRSTGVPVYNFCVAVDDALMGITTVIRAEEHLTNTLRQVLILRALGFPTPQYAHCSLILGEDRSKLSKRHGATSVTQFKEEGYLPAAMINYLALLGWNDGSEKEIYTVDELIHAFDINRITKSPAVFDGSKLRWMNGQHLRALPRDEIEPLVVDHWLQTGVFTAPGMAVGTELAEKGLALVQNALELVADCEQEMRDCLSYPLAQTVSSEEASELVAEGGGFRELAEIVLAAYDDGSLPVGQDKEEHMAVWKKWVKSTGKGTGRKGKALFHPLRLAVTGKMSGPDVGAVLEVLTVAEKGNASPEMVTIAQRMHILRGVVDSL